MKIFSLLLVLMTIPLVLTAQNDSVAKYYVKDFKLSVKNKSIDKTYEFEELNSLTIKKDSIFVQRFPKEHRFKISDLTSIHFRDGSYVVTGLAIGAGLGTALITLGILTRSDEKCGGHPAICLPPEVL